MRVIELSLTNICNGYCSYCPYVSPKKAIYMNDEIIDEIVNIIPKFGTDEIHLAGMCEPTLHPNYLKIANRLTNLCKVEIATNAIDVTHLRELDEKIIVSIHKLKNMSTLYYSTIKIMERLLKNYYIEEVVEEEMYSRCGKVFRVELRLAKNCLYIEDSYEHDYLNDRILIDCNGDVLLCCFDWDKKKFGNILNDSFDKIIKKRKEYLEDMRLQTNVHSNDFPCFKCENGKE